jgi:hypothetical protein
MRSSLKSALTPLVALAVAVVFGVIVLSTLDDEVPPLATYPAMPDTPCLRSASDPGVFPTDISDTASPYAGPGPHPVFTVFQGLDDDDTRQLSRRSRSSDWFDIPREWRVLAPSTPTVQLVLCEYVIDTGAQPVDECFYNVPVYKAPVYDARYRFVLYEAKTSKRVTTFELNGTKVHCDNNVPYPRDRTPNFIVVKLVEDAVLVDHLRPFVETNR